MQKINEVLKKIKLKKTDIVLIHGDAAIAFNYLNNNNYFKIFFDDLVAYFQDGLVIVPNFTYTHGKKEVFEKDNSKSKIGIFSEEFRKYAKGNRTLDPFFSVSYFGKKKVLLKKIDCSNCFGNQSIFNFLMKKNAKILFLGTLLNSLTFLHYVEQKIGVSYRFFKKFKSRVKTDKGIIEKEITYYARKDTSKNFYNFERLEKILKKKKLINFALFNRLPVFQVNVKNLYKEISATLN